MRVVSTGRRPTAGRIRTAWIGPVAALLLLHLAQLVRVQIWKTVFETYLSEWVHHIRMFSRNGGKMSGS